MGLMWNGRPSFVSAPESLGKRASVGSEHSKVNSLLSGTRSGILGTRSSCLKSKFTSTGNPRTESFWGRSAALSAAFENLHRLTGKYPKLLVSTRLYRTKCVARPFTSVTQKISVPVFPDAD